MKDDADHEDESGFSVKAAVEGECTNGSDGKKSCKDLNKCTERDLRGIVMDAVIVGAPLCSTV